MSDISNYLILNELNANIVFESKYYCIFGDNGNQILIVNNYDRVFGFGYNENGLLGLGHNNNVTELIEVIELREKSIIKISYGTNHVMALSQSGQCFSWGKGLYGQLGNGSTDDHNKPNPIHESINGLVTDICCGSHHSLVLTNLKEVYVFGNNSFGQIGNGNNENQIIPFKIETFGEEVDAISCGYWHSMALTQSGKVFGWGYCNNGEIGCNNGQNTNTIKEVICYDFYGFSACITKISCGRNHSLLLSNRGHVFGVGYNNCGQIGKTSHIKQLTPVQMSDRNDFIDIESQFNSNISIALTKNGFYSIWGKNKDKPIFIPRENGLKSFHNIYSLYLKNKTTENRILFDQKPNKLKESLFKSFNNPEKSDLKIKIQDKLIYVNKTVLKLCCKHFETMFSKNWSESASNEIEVQEYSYEVYYKFLKYIYTDSIDIKASEVNQLLDLANAYFEEELKQKCIQFIINELSVENICDMFSIAVKYELQELENYCLEFSANKWNEVFTSDGFKRMDKTFSMKLIESAAKKKLF